MAASLWMASEPLVLASRSAGRMTMLAQAGIPIEAVPAEIDERALEARAAAEPDGRSVALRLAGAKACAVAGLRPGRIVLGADQTLLLDGVPFHKPAGFEEAVAQLMALAGRTHVLESAAVLMRDSEVLAEITGTAQVALRRLPETSVRAYLDAAAPAVLASVGCYHVEGLGAHLFERIEGDHFTIMGLPLLPLLAVLRRLGVVLD